MSADDPFSVEAARRADDAGRLAEWVTTFLASPGSDNEPLAADLALRGASFLGPVRLALDDLRPLAGPDDHDVSIPVPGQEWDEEVDAMDESLALGDGSPRRSSSPTEAGSTWWRTATTATMPFAGPVPPTPGPSSPSGTSPSDRRSRPPLAPDAPSPPHSWRSVRSDADALAELGDRTTGDPSSREP